MQAISNVESLESAASDSTPPQSWEFRFHAVMAAAACGAIAISICGYCFLDLTMHFSAALPIFILLLAIGLAAAQYRWREEHKCFNVVMMVFWVVLVTNFHFFPMYMAARTDVPMNDALLASYDRALGFEVPDVRAALAPYPRLNEFLLATYMTLIPLMTAATVIPPMLNRMDKAKEFVVGCIIAASISMPIFACLQAVGPWEYYGFPPAIDSLSEKAPLLAALKTSGEYVIDPANRDGLITFPSFHVVLTVLAAVALLPFRWLRWPVALWASLIVISTVTTGIHYTIDVVGGLCLAAVAYAGAKAYSRVEQWDWSLARVRKSPIAQRPPECFARESLTAK